jgi:hypothetical protein
VKASQLKPVVDNLESVRDLATKRGRFTIRHIALGDYLAELRLFDQLKARAGFDGSIASTFQRATFDIRKNVLKQRMLRDVLCGGTLPPIVVFDRPGDRPAWTIVDGLQRTHVLTEALKALLALEHGGPVEDFAQIQIDALKQQGRRQLSVTEFLNRPVVLQVWEDLEPDELVRLFMLLNVGQQKVSPRHLLEVVHIDLRKMFESWGIRLLTEKEEKAIPRRRGRKPPEMMVIPSVTHFRYEFLIDGLIAYVSRDPQIKTRAVLEDEDGINRRLAERVTEIGSEVCRDDFQWVCLDLNRLINKRYADNPKWRGIIQTSDNFFIPLMAALGEARGNARSKAAIVERKQQLLEILKDVAAEDPLRFYAGSANCLEHLLNDVRSNIGRKRRAIVYFAWRSFFRDGLYDEAFPVDWHGAAMAE